MNKQTPPWALIATIIAGGGLSAIAQAFQSALPQGATLIANIVGILVAAAGLVVTYYQAINAPAKALIGNPAGNIPVVDVTGQHLANVVTTTSTDPIKAPQAQKDPTP